MPQHNSRPMKKIPNRMSTLLNADLSVLRRFEASPAIMDIYSAPTIVKAASREKRETLRTALGYLCVPIPWRCPKGC
jgi:hypothetical protein